MTNLINKALLECFEEYFKANGTVKNILYVRDFHELHDQLINKKYEIKPIDNSNHKVSGGLVIADLNNLNLENKTSVKYWILNSPKE